MQYATGDHVEPVAPPSAAGDSLMAGIMSVIQLQGFSHEKFHSGLKKLNPSQPHQLLLFKV